MVILSGFMLNPKPLKFLLSDTNIYVEIYRSEELK